MCNKGIQLKNIDLRNYSEAEQFNKIKEEEEEFKEAFLNFSQEDSVENKDHLVEEFLDYFQAYLGILNMKGISAEYITERYSKHLYKLKNRPRTKNQQE